MAEIQLRGLAHAYRPNPQGPQDYALKRLDHTWRSGGAYALLGPSGCGKTTLLNIISGLVQPSEGQVLFDGNDVTQLATEKRNIAQVFQFPVIYDTMTVAENLAFPLRNRGLPRAEIEARVAETAAMLDLTATLGRKARNLTADAKQKISLGRGLVRRDVNAILFDEPLTVIDPQLKWQLRTQLKQLHKRFDFTMIYVTHDQTEALTFADQVVVMYEGEVVQMGTPEELFERPAHTFVGYFIGSPGMNILSARVEGTEALVGNQRLRLPRAYDNLPASAKVQLGIRPEFVLTGAPGGLTARVVRVSDVGRYKIAQLSLDGLPLNAVLPEDAPLGDGQTTIAFDPSRLHVYLDGRILAGTAIAGERR